MLNLRMDEEVFFVVSRLSQRAIVSPRLAVLKLTRHRFEIYVL